MTLPDDMFADHRRRFPVERIGYLAEQYGQNVSLPDEHHTCDTATIWTLHLRISPTVLATSLDEEQPLATVEEVQVAADRIMATGAEVLTGDYIGGDSFGEWCEVFDGSRFADSGRALHVYFHAANLAAACRTGAILAAFAGIADASDACISAGGDWAEQAECFPVEATA